MKNFTIYRVCCLFFVHLLSYENFISEMFISSFCYLHLLYSAVYFDNYNVNNDVFFGHIYMLYSSISCFMILYNSTDLLQIFFARYKCIDYVL
jgi:hypothetical protein